VRAFLRYVNQRVVICDQFVHWLLTLTWVEVVTVGVSASLFCILVFGGLFYAAGDYTNMGEAFALSTQTYLTIGYGVLGPQTLVGHVLVYIETFIAMTLLVVVTGVPYIKFSKPSTKMSFAKPVVNVGEKGPQLQIRLCMDVQNASMVNACFKLTLARTERSALGTVREPVCARVRGSVSAYGWEASLRVHVSVLQAEVIQCARAARRVHAFA
jgi:hypothetical protein